MTSDLVGSFDDVKLPVTVQDEVTSCVKLRVGFDTDCCTVTVCVPDVMND